MNSITVLIILGLLFSFFFFKTPIWPIFLIVCVWLLVIIMGSAFVGWNFHFTSLNANHNTSKNHIAITFDDSPNPEFTMKALKLLKEFDAKATFFCIGKHIELYPDIFKNIIEAGHTVGNHTYSHDNKFGFFSTAEVVSELTQTNAIIKQQTGLVAQFYRPAFGVTNPRIKRALQITGLQSIGWSKRSLDTTGLSEKRVLRRVTNKLKNGDVILLHDNSQKTILVLERLLLFLQQRNIESVTIDTLFNIKPYA